MKKYISILLCLSLVIGLASPMRVFAADYVGNAGSVVVGAQKILTELDVTKPITKDTWGDATIHVDKNSVNTTLASWNDQTVEDVEMDLYFRWDENYLYVGVVSEDKDHSKRAYSYDEADGVQIKINVGASRTDDWREISITYNAAEMAVVNTKETSKTSYGGLGDYKYNIQFVENKMHVVAAISFAELDLSASNVKAGLAFSYSMARLDSQQDKGSDWATFTGWLSWGSHFGDNKTAKKELNVNCTTDNIVVLTNEVAQTGTVVNADKAYNTVDLKDITSWGTPSIIVDKDSYNAVLKNYNHTAEDTSMKIYTRWDDEYLYIGVISEEKGLTGSSNYWDGDGIQFGLSSNASPAKSIMDICLTFAEDKSTVMKSPAVKDDYDYELSVKTVGETSEMHAAIKIPFADISDLEDEVKAGLALNFSIVRITATADDIYAGWLVYGSFWGEAANAAGGNTNNGTKCCVSENKIVLTDNVADMATVVKADKVYNKVDLKNITSWGTPTIHVDKNTYNATLTSHPDHLDISPEEIDMDVYMRWDNENLYIGIVTPDEDICGVGSSWKGDGIQFEICAGTTRGSASKNIHFALDENKVDVVGGGANDDCDYDITQIGNKLHMAISIPFSQLGITDVEAGVPICFSMIRISGRNGGENYDYAGWLAWGTLWGVSERTTPGCVGDNVIVLTDNVATNATTIVADKATSRIDLNDIKSWGKPAISVNKDSYNATLDGHRDENGNVAGTPEDVSMDIYTKWDDKNLYIGVVSPDTDVMGCDEESWKGDGIQFKISTGTKLSDTASQNIYFSINKDGLTASIGDTTYSYALKIENDVMYAAVAVPFEKLAMSNLDIKAGATLAIDLIRISGTKDDEYAGWLAWGSFFDAPYCQSCVGDNVIVLVNSTAVDVPDNSGTVDKFESLLTAIDTEAGQYILDSAIGSEFGDSAEHKIITTKNGTYVLYITRNVTCGSNTVVNEFTLVQIVDGEAVEVAYNYTYDSLVDMVADKDGNIYIVSGSSSTTLNKIKNSNDAEKAILNIFKYDETTKALNGQKAYRAFTSTAKEHKYLGSTIDTANGKIYTAYIGIDENGKYTCVEYFTYDIETGKYAKETTAYDVSLDKITNSTVVALENGMGFICSDGTNISYFVADGTKTVIAQGNFEDAYVNADGSVNVLGGNTFGIITIGSDGSVTKTNPDGNYTYKFVKVGDELYIIAMDTENAAQVKLYNAKDLSLVKTVKLDEVVKYKSSFMVALDLTGSTDSITVMFAGNRGKVTHWYSATVPVENVTE